MINIVIKIINSKSLHQVNSIEVSLESYKARINQLSCLRVERFEQVDAHLESVIRFLFAQYFINFSLYYDAVGKVLEGYSHRREFWDIAGEMIELCCINRIDADRVLDVEVSRKQNISLANAFGQVWKLFARKEMEIDREFIVDKFHAFIESSYVSSDDRFNRFQWVGLVRFFLAEITF